MSKAFVKDDAPTEEIGLYRRDLTDGAPNYMTLQGFERLKAEVARLQDEKKALGSDSSPDTTERIRALEGRLALLSSSIETAQVIDPSNQQGDRVVFGATVTVLDENGSERIYQIVGVDETDAASGRVSWISPIGKALLQKQIGDEVIFKTPQKTENLEVAQIEFKPIL